jgi:hypothetical protein
VLGRLFSSRIVTPTGATPTALKPFDLKTGVPKGSIPLPGQATLCNDVVVAGDGTAYVIDSFADHILRLNDGMKLWPDERRDLARALLSARGFPTTHH